MIMNHIRHAVLHTCWDRSQLLWIDGNTFHHEELPDPLYQLNDLAEAARQYHITHVWVMPAYGEFFRAENHDEWSYKITERNHHMAAASVWKRGWGKNVNIIFPQHTAWGWNDIGPHDLLITIRYLQQALGVTIGASPGRVGWTYLKKLHPQWVETIPQFDWKAAHFTSAAAPDIIWQRALTTTERENGVFVHKFDESAAYPYAASQTDMGVGTPVYLHAEMAGRAAVHEKGHPQSVGVWRCTLHSFPLNADNGMPPIWKKTTGWLAGPMIRLLSKIGYTVEIHEAYVFPDRHDLLVKWANSLWLIRQGFILAAGGTWKNEKCAKLAAKATKTVMNATIGMTAFRKFDEEKDDEMKRPDIRLQAIARHVELKWHRIEKIRTLYGITPVLIYMDALYYISSESDGRKLFPELMKREGQFGGYRYEGRVALDEPFSYTFKGDNAPTAFSGPLMRDLLEDNRYSEGNKLEVLNAKGWVR